MALASKVKQRIDKGIKLNKQHSKILIKYKDNGNSVDVYIEQEGIVDGKRFSQQELVARAKDIFLEAGVPVKISAKAM